MRPAYSPILSPIYSAIRSPFDTRRGGPALYPTLASLPRPVLLSHRGGLLVEAENSLSAVNRSLVGTFGIETDVQITSDSVPILMHDASIDRTTNGTGNVASLTFSQIQGFAIDAGSWLAPGYTSEPIPTLAQFFAACRGRRLMVPEGKNEPSVNAIIAAAQAAGIPGNQLIIQSFTLAHLVPVVAAGYGALFLINSMSSPPNWAGVAGAGVFLCGYGFSGASDSTQIALAAAQGIQCIAYTVNRRVDMQTALASGAIGVFTDDPEYLAKSTPLYLQDSWANQKWMPGMLIGPGSYRGSLGTPGAFIIDSMPQAGAYRGATQGWLGVLPQSYRLSFNMALDAVGNDTRWGAVFICAQSDGLYDDTAGSPVGGYHLLMRRNGDMTIFRKVPGQGAVQIASNPTGDVITIGVSTRYHIDVTPASITLTNATTGKFVTTTDTTYRNGYAAFGSNFSMARYSSVALTPA